MKTAEASQTYLYECEWFDQFSNQLELRFMFLLWENSETDCRKAVENQEKFENISIKVSSSKRKVVVKGKGRKVSPTKISQAMLGKSFLVLFS